MGNHGLKSWRLALLIGLALLLIAAPLALADDDDDGDDDGDDEQSGAPLTVIVGEVTQASQRGDDLFVQLDASGDGNGDVWIKIDDDTVLINPQGQRVSSDVVTVGTTLSVTDYEYEDAYYEAYRIVVHPSNAAGQDPLHGTIVDRFWFGSGLVVGLDADGDGAVEIEAAIVQDARILSPSGTPLGFAAVQPGTELTLVIYDRSEAGLYEARHVIVAPRSSAQPTDGAPLIGEILEVIRLGAASYLTLDADGDGFVDYPVRVDAETQLVDAQGRPLSPDALRAGGRVRVSEYRFDPDAGYYRAERVVILD